MASASGARLRPRERLATGAEYRRVFRRGTRVDSATFLLVVIAWVFFRAENFEAARSLLVSMAGAHGFVSNLARIHMNSAWFTIAVLLPVVWFLPNSHQLLARFEPTLEYATGQGAGRSLPRWLAWRPRPAWALALAALGLCAVLGLSRVSEFIYWQF